MPALAGAYTNPTYALPWGKRSHWLQAWRGYLETLPAARFVDGLGMNLNLTTESPELIIRMLAEHGIKHCRYEIGWGAITWNEDGFVNVPVLAAALQAMKAHGVRPLILLNANHGKPCPTQTVTRAVTVQANAGATSVILDSNAGLVAGRSGFSDQWAADILLTVNTSGTTWTLSKPLPVLVPAGTQLPVTTLKYRPFSVPGSADYVETMAGWKRYVDLIRQGLVSVFGVGGAFDLEIWNELTFGSAFLSIKNYYADSSAYAYDETTIITNLVAETAAYLDANSAAFSGVVLADGMGSTNPFPASSTEPTRVTALCHHPYPPRQFFPADETDGQFASIQPVNALGANDSYAPSYAARFPEYFGTCIQTESALRDAGPLTNAVGATQHGRNARPGGPVECWLTEINLAWNWSDMDPAYPAGQVDNFKARVTARFAAFWLGKGCQRISWFAVNDASPTNDDVSLVADNFLALARTPGATYPSPDTSYVSLALLVLQRMAAKFATGLDRSLTLATTRPISISSITDTHNHAQFAGDGTAAHPALFNREVLFLQPFQVNASRFVIPYYVMTRDVLALFSTETYTVKFSGLGKGSRAPQVSSYDPITNVTSSVTITARTSTTLTVALNASDYPRLLIVQER